VQGDQVVTSIMANVGYTQESAEVAIQSGDVDMISFGRAYISNPDLDVRFAAGAPLNVDQGHDTWMAAGVGARGYTDYPFLDPEATTDEMSAQVEGLKV
jgi:N-ethylmaleimide reductase